jgi:hypothetical protein
MMMNIEKMWQILIKGNEKGFFYHIKTTIILKELDSVAKYQTHEPTWSRWSRCLNGRALN